MTDIEVWLIELPISLAASIMNGPWMTQWPPPEGAKKLMKNELMRPQNGRVPGVATSTNTCEMVFTSPEPAMMARMPAENGYCMVMREVVLMPSFRLAT